MRNRGDAYDNSKIRDRNKTPELSNWRIVVVRKNSCSILEQFVAIRVKRKDI